MSEIFTIYHFDDIQMISKLVLVREYLVFNPHSRSQLILIGLCLNSFSLNTVFSQRLSNFVPCICYFYYTTTKSTITINTLLS